MARIDSFFIPNARDKDQAWPQVKVGMPTPWGEAEHITEVCPGMWFLSTCGHGGYYLRKTLNSLIPKEHRRASFKGLGIEGWWEGDCDWAFVCLRFPQHFPAHALEAARAMIQSIHPELNVE
jgi:hypothetical protein